MPVFEYRVPVGLEPVAVAARTNTEVWVTNLLSDSVSIVSLTGTPHVVRTLLVGDEPRDIVFAGNPVARFHHHRASRTAAHRSFHRRRAGRGRSRSSRRPAFRAPTFGFSIPPIWDQAWAERR